VEGGTIYYSVEGGTIYYYVEGGTIYYSSRDRKDICRKKCFLNCRDYFTLE
jgi:hypothetical protein